MPQPVSFRDATLISFETNRSRNWLAFGPFLNNLRIKKYGMRPLSWVWAMRDVLQAKIPHVCLWSSHILPRPSEWDQNVRIGGYTSLDHGTDYTAPKSLQAFLETDKPILAISFGSMSIPDPAEFLSAVFSAVGRNQSTAVICRSWSAKLETDIAIPPYIYLADSIPHSWLLPRVNGFVHHGGAGHTAAGLRAGVPMLLIPFFLDQHFWAAKISELELGPPPLKIRDITTQELATRFRHLLSGRYQNRCAKMAMQIQAEGDGAEVTADVVLQQMALPDMNVSCSVIPSLRAHWRHIDSGLPLSGAAAASLESSGVLSWEDLDLQPRINWTDQWQGAPKPLGWVHMLCKVTRLFKLILGFFHAILIWFVELRGDIRSAEENSYAVKMRDPVVQARIRQGMFDQQFIKGNVDEKEAAEMDNRVIRRWQALAAMSSQT